MRKKKAQVSIYISFMILAIFIILITGVFAPMGVLFSTEMYAAGEDIMLRANDSISKIQDTTIKAQIYDSVSSGLSSAQTNINVNSDLFRYSWLIVIGVVGLVLFLITRRIVEVQTGGFV